MEINRRIKPRQSGKSTDILEMAELMLSLGRKVVILLPTDREVALLRQFHTELIHNEDYKGRLMIGSASNLNFLRGHRADIFLVDEFGIIKNQQEITSTAIILGARIYSTET